MNLKSLDLIPKSLQVLRGQTDVVPLMTHPLVAYIMFRFLWNPDVAGNKGVEDQKQIWLVGNTTSSYRYCWSGCGRPKSKGPDGQSPEQAPVALWKTQDEVEL